GYAQVQNRIYVSSKKNGSECQTMCSTTKDVSGSGFNLNSDVLNERTFQMLWLYYSLINFTFMTTDDIQFKIPSSLLDSDDTDLYFEETKENLYKKFVHLWTNHHKFTKKCDAHCSTVFVVDGHQKANRLVCKFRDVYDKSIPEFGINGIQIGCPNTPMRQNEQSAKCHSGYCKNHQKEAQTLSEFLQLQKFEKAQNFERPVTRSTTNKLLRNEEENIDLVEKELDQTALTGIKMEDLCNVVREGISSVNKTTSYGFLATFLNCGVIVGYDEMPMAEGMRRVLRHIMRILQYGHLPDAMCYDTACSLSLFIEKHYNTPNLLASSRTKFFKDMDMAIDRFHVKNHVRHMCQGRMRPDDLSHGGRYMNINTQVCGITRPTPGCTRMLVLIDHQRRKEELINTMSARKQRRQARLRLEQQLNEEEVYPYASGAFD
ncbi:unnamed protein product, partial [Didymodactylos carnosus]